MEFKQTLAAEASKFNTLLTSSDDLAHLQLVPDNDTRWNSTYFMVKRAVKLRESVDLYYTQSVLEKDGISLQDVLKDDDWNTLTELRAVLRPFAQVTKAFEGNGPTLSGIVQALHYLRKSLTDHLKPAGQATSQPQPQISSEMPPPPTPSRRPQRQPQLPRHLEDYEIKLPGQRSTTPAPHIQDSITVDTPLAHNNASNTLLPWAGITAAVTKLDEYISCLGDSHAYWFAMILHPGHRKRWMELQLERSQMDHWIAAFKQHFNSQYASQEAVAADTNKPAPHGSPKHNFLTDPDYYNDMEDHDEVERYLSERPKQVDDPLAWWRANMWQYPRLSSMAFDYLSIPVMSSECERLFSRAKHCVGIQRHSLHADSINMLQSLKNWLGKSAV